MTITKVFQSTKALAYSTWTTGLLLAISTVGCNGPEELASVDSEARGGSSSCESTSTNVALNKPTSQSSTGHGGVSSRAVDGNTSGHWAHGSVTHTNHQAGAWWRVDLGGAHSVDQVVIWNRTDCCTNRLSNYHVEYLDQNANVIETQHFSGSPSPSVTMAVAASNVHAVRVRLAGTNPLSLAEVEVIGSASGSTNVALNKPTSQSSTAGPATASRAVDGNTDGNYFNGSVTHTNGEAGAWWQVDLQGAHSVDRVVIWNRTDCCSNRLSNYHVEYLDQNSNVIQSQHFSGNPNPSVTMAVAASNVHAVRVRLAGANYLSLAEVQVFGSVAGSTNVALNKPTSQSSTGHGGVSTRAVDGNTSGHWAHGSVTHTNHQAGAWWQVDLQGAYSVDQVVIWNRTDCCSSRLSNYHVEYLDQNANVIQSQHFSGSPNPSVTMSVAASNVHAVRVRLAGTNPLSLAEVQVFARCAPPPSPVSVSALVTPFDANRSFAPNWDDAPDHFYSNFGRRPEIIVASDGSDLDVLVQDYDDTNAFNAVLFHVEPSGGSYVVTEALTNLPMLDRIMGLDRDAAGNRYYATGVDEYDAVTPTYPAPSVYRQNITRVVKIDNSGSIVFNLDLDIERSNAFPSPEQIIRPMVNGTGRLAVGGNEIALVHGVTTAPDTNGWRHQKALATRLNATTGEITAPATVWVSHSFDQRLFFDGQDIMEMHLGDLYPRSIVLERDHQRHDLFRPKGNGNATRTRLGNVAAIENDPTYGYLALISTENNNVYSAEVNDSRNLAIIRASTSDLSLDPSMPDTQFATQINPGGSTTNYNNRLRWITNYSNPQFYAERPKLVGIGGDQYIVLWELWDSTVTWLGVYGMVINAQGDTLVAPTLITSDHHLHRGDDAFLLDGCAGWMTGDSETRQLQLHLVSSSLDYEMVTLD